MEELYNLLKTNPELISVTIEPNDTDEDTGPAIDITLKIRDKNDGSSFRKRLRIAETVFDEYPAKVMPFIQSAIDEGSISKLY